MNNTVASNVATSGGGGISCSSSSPKISGNTVSGCNATAVGGGGGGIYYYNATLPTITDDIIVANSARNDGGGIFCDHCTTATVTNCVIAGNRASGGGGGGIYCMMSPALAVTNDTIAGNDASFFGGGMQSDPFSLPVVTNCIVWHNSSDLVGCSATYSDVSALGGGLAGDISADPEFVSAADGDYRLESGSPCVGVASSTVAPVVDKDGIPRPWGVGSDVGAYEYYVPTYHTSTGLSAPKSARVKRTLTLSGNASPSAASPYLPLGAVTITMSRKVGKKWRSAGSARVNLVGGAFVYSFKPKYKGSWRFVASYSGGVVGPTTFLSSASGTRAVTVK
jgi:parallel beta-helix repeat protein/predicted outer membrane repeat protein